MSSLLPSLSATVSGQGKPLLAIHGWGMNQQIWQPVQAGLSTCAEVSWVDLPGHGSNHEVLAESFEDWVQRLGELLQPETVIMGWSLGGLVAQALAHAYPEKVKGLVLVASTPRFVQGESWIHGVAPDVLQGFASNLQQDFQATVKRFFALQFMGVRHDPKELRRLQQDVLAYPADAAALQLGLKILGEADFTTQLPKVPALWLFGKLDRLIPISLAATLQQHSQLSAGSQVEVLAQAAHVPFVTHSQQFLELTEPFIKAVHND